MEKISRHIKNLLKTLPQSPGVYQFYDAKGTVLYVGKAKNLKKRVSSYFNKHHDNAKTKVLVKKIRDIKHIVVETETDALLLENNLIKRYRPRYNVMLKDDKTYPWICIKKEAFPRVFLTRNVIKDGSEYYGPYTSVRMAKALLSLIEDLYPLRTCYYQLSEKYIRSGKYKVCLEYHIGNCKGACAGLQQEEDYLRDIAEIRLIIKGEIKPVLKEFHRRMKNLSEEWRFEEAQRIKEKIERLAGYQARSTVINPNISNVDVFSIYSDRTHAYVNFFKVVNGAIVQSHTAEVKKKLQESDREILEHAILDIRSRYHSVSKEIYVPFELTVPEGIKVHIPKKGEKKHLLDLSLRNAKYYRLERIKHQKITHPEQYAERILLQLQKDLHLTELPVHIECFDNSNIQGVHPVAACVVFKNAKPSKEDYRKFHIKNVKGPDDFATMEEVVFRRYKRLLDEGADLPQLIVIDGGKGQLSSAVKSLEALGLTKRIAVIGIAKKLEEIFLPGDPYPFHLDKRSESLKIIQQLRNEAHRFGIGFHRKTRMKKNLQSELTSINGIGIKTAEQLLQVYKSVSVIKNTPVVELAKIIGKHKAEIIRRYFNPSD